MLGKRDVWCICAERRRQHAGGRVLRRVQAVNLTLSAGELLYLPAGWFHCVANLEPTVMVNVWTRGQERVGVP